METKPPPGPAPVYATLYPGLCDAVRPLGYALALLGSMRRDLDMVAVPWTEEASPAADVAEAVRAFIDGFIIADHENPTVNSPAQKPHGRLSYAIHFETGGDFYVDLSVLPLSMRRANLRECRRAAGMKQADAARLAGVSRTYWSLVETGRTDAAAVSIGTARRMCSAVQRPVHSVAEFAGVPT